MTDTSKTKATLPYLSLADINTPVGAMERAFLAEARSPDDPEYNPQVNLEAMRDMRQVVENRLKAPSEYMARGATDAIGIFKAPDQFPSLQPILRGYLTMSTMRFSSPTILMIIVKRRIGSMSRTQ